MSLLTKMSLRTNTLRTNTLNVIIGKTGTGKSNLAINLIPHFGGFEKIMVFSDRKLEHTPYKLLSKVFPNFVYSSESEFEKATDELVDTTLTCLQIKTLVIIDNENFFDHYPYNSGVLNLLANENVTVVSILQCFYDVPKQMRSSIDYLFLMGGMDKLELKGILRTYPSTWKKNNLKPSHVWELYRFSTPGTDIDTEFFTIDTKTSGSPFSSQITKKFSIDGPYTRFYEEGMTPSRVAKHGNGEIKYWEYAEHWFQDEEVIIMKREVDGNVFLLPFEKFKTILEDKRRQLICDIEESRKRY